MKSTGKGLAASFFAGMARWIEDRSVRRGSNGGYLIKSGWIDTRVYEVDEAMKQRYLRWTRVIYALLLLAAALVFVAYSIPLIDIWSDLVGRPFLLEVYLLRHAGASLLIAMVLFLAPLLVGPVIYVARQGQLRRYSTATLREWHHAPLVGQESEHGADPIVARGSGGIARWMRARIARATVLRRNDGSYLVRCDRVYHVDPATKEKYLAWAFRRNLWFLPFSVLILLYLVSVGALWLHTGKPGHSWPPLLFLSWILVPLVVSRTCPHLRGCPTVPLREWWFPDA